jgi:nucleoside-diphosphate kinase
MSTYTFQAERFDRLANEYFDYLIMFHKTASGGELEVIEAKSKRRFTRREPTALTIAHLYLGAVVVVNSFQLTITAYNDAATSAALAKLHEKTLAVVHGASFASLGKILTAAHGFGFTTARLQTIEVTAATQQLLKEAGVEPVAKGLTAIIVLLRPNAVVEWQKLSQRFGSPDGVYSSPSVEAAAAEIEAVVGGLAGVSSARCTKKSSLCLIKPHAVSAGHAGAIVQQLADTGLRVTAVEQVNVSKEDALEFLASYRGVLPEFSSQVEAIYCGPAIAVEVNDDDAENGAAVVALRQVAGPYDTTFAKCLVRGRRVKGVTTRDQGAARVGSGAGRG